MVSINHWSIDTILPKSYGIYQPWVNRYHITKILSFSEILKHSQSTQQWLKEAARDFLQHLFLGLQMRMYDVLRIVRFVEPFSLPNFKNTAPQLSDYRHPFFKTDVVSRSNLER